MNTFTHAELDKLLDWRNPVCLSLYMSTYHTPDRANENIIRFKNLISEAVKRLNKDRGFRETEAHAFLSPAYKLLKDIPYWQSCQEGLCVFISHGLSGTWQVPLRLENNVYISDHFHLKELLPLFVNNSRYYVLSLSQERVRFFSGDQYHIEEHPLNGTPLSMEEILKHHDTEKHLQFHSRTAFNFEGVRDAMFHGHGTATEDSKESLKLFLQRLDYQLLKHVQDRKPQLILAGVDYTCAMYQNISHYPNISTKHITGHPDQLRPQELFAQAKEIMGSQADQKTVKYKEAIQTQFNRNQSSNDIRKILPKANSGIVQALFIPSDSHVWGRFEEQESQVRLRKKSARKVDDLLDLAARYTLQHGGEVFVSRKDDMPLESDIAALFRY